LCPRAPPAQFLLLPGGRYDASLIIIRPNGRYPKRTLRLRTFFLEIFGGCTSVLDGLWLTLPGRYDAPLIIIRPRQDVCHSSPFCGQSPFRTIRQLIHPAFVVVFDELFEMEIVRKMGRSGTRLSKTDVRPPKLSMLPNEDVGKRNSTSGVSFRWTLRGCEYSIWATNHRKVPRKDTPDISRRQLTPVFDKPAFSRFFQNCEPLIVVEIFGKIVKRQVCQNGGELPTAA